MHVFFFGSSLILFEFFFDPWSSSLLKFGMMLKLVGVFMLMSFNHAFYKMTFKGLLEVLLNFGA
jgi:hypothetical protein